MGTSQKGGVVKLPAPGLSAGLVKRINVFLREADMPHSVFGRSVARDPRLVTDLRNGREAGPSLVRRADSFMHDWRRAYEAGRVHREGDRRRSRQERRALSQSD